MSDTCHFRWKGDCLDRMLHWSHRCSKNLGHPNRRHQCSCGEYLVTPPPNDLLTDHPFEEEQ